MAYGSVMIVRGPREQPEAVAIGVDGDQFAEPLGMPSERSGGCGGQAAVSGVEVGRLETQAPAAAWLPGGSPPHDRQPGIAGGEQGVLVVHHPP